MSLASHSGVQCENINSNTSGLLYREINTRRDVEVESAFSRHPLWYCLLGCEYGWSGWRRWRDRERCLCPARPCRNPGRAPVLWTKRRARAELPPPPARSASGIKMSVSDEEACSWLYCRGARGASRPTA